MKKWILALMIIIGLTSQNAYCATLSEEGYITPTKIGLGALGLYASYKGIPALYNLVNKTDEINKNKIRQVALQLMYASDMYYAILVAPKIHARQMPLPTDIDPFKNRLTQGLNLLKTIRTGDHLTHRFADYTLKVLTLQPLSFTWIEVLSKLFREGLGDYLDEPMKINAYLKACIDVLNSQEVHPKAKVLIVNLAITTIDRYKDIRYVADVLHGINPFPWGAPSLSSLKNQLNQTLTITKKDFAANQGGPEQAIRIIQQVIDNWSRNP